MALAAAAPRRVGSGIMRGPQRPKTTQDSATDMARRSMPSIWARTFQRSLKSITRSTVRAGTRVATQAVREVTRKPKPPAGAGEWISGLAFGPAGARRYHLFRPAGVRSTERLPLLVMLHGCGQDAKAFAQSTRMNRLAARERFLVLYPEQDRRANPQGCWNWYETRSGLAYGEAAIVNAAVDQVCQLYPADRERIAVAGLSAGASLGALLATRYPERFKAVVMHSGVPPGTAHSMASAWKAMRGRAVSTLPDAGSVWPPLLVIHGAADRVVAANNGSAAAQVWAEAAGAQPGGQRCMRRGKRYPMTVTEYKVRGRTVATLCDVQTLDHAWSGGDPRHSLTDPLGPDASRMVWAFAQRQFQPRASTRRPG
jgi:poly(hydroxyalkanoate) depolymerase family esterase